MILTDGTTTFTYARGSDEEPDTMLDESESTSAGGLLRGQVSGERFVSTVTVRITPAERRTLVDLLNQPSANFDYTPDTVSDEYTDLLGSDLFPMNVRVKLQRERKRVWNGEIFYYITMEIKSVGYL